MDGRDQINAADINVRRVHLYMTNYHHNRFIECRGHNEYHEHIEMRVEIQNGTGSLLIINYQEVNRRHYYYN